MRYNGKIETYHYFGEWSDKLDQPHGRGVWFGDNTIRVGYFTQSECSDGKVFRVVTYDDAINVEVGKETFINGDTHRNAKSHVAGRGRGKKGCWEYKYINSAQK